MEKNKIIEAVDDIFIEIFELDKNELTEDKILFKDLGLDSLDMVDLIVEINKKTGINLRNDDTIKDIRTLGDVYKFVEKFDLEHPDKI
ncbi:MAG: acyl carrier protein [bacterium]|nr:acyl carrier protein [bacterium]